MKSHVFITTKYIDRCLETGLFGVTPVQLNYLANVQLNDTVFLLETGSGRLIGPFSVTQPLFFNSSPIWEQIDDPFVNRIKFSSDEVWESDIRSLWSVLLNRPVNNFYTFTTFQRSNVTLLPGEGRHLAEVLASDGQRIHPSLESDISIEKINLFKNDRVRFSSEARLEAALLMNQAYLKNILVSEGILPPSSDTYLINQITLPGTNYNVDIALFADNLSVIIELKKDNIDQKTNEQILRYSNYWKLSGKNVHAVAIGCGISEHNDQILSFSYSINYPKSMIVIRGVHGSYEIPV
jgi:hypothetical protein